MSTQRTQAPPSASPRTAGGMALLVVLFASFMDLLDATIVVVAAPAVATDLHATDAQIQWTVAAYTLALGSGLITGGRIGDDYGRRRVFLGSLAAFAVASALCGLAPGAGWLIAARVIQGLAGGIMVPQVFGIIRSSLDGPGQARAFGAFGAVQGLAAVAGPLLSGFLVDADFFGWGWRAIFFVNVPVTAVALILGARALPESHAPVRSRLDVLGAALIASAIVLILLPIVQGPDWGWPAWGWGLLIAGILLVLVFLAHEQRVARAGGNPVFDPALLRVRSFSSGLAASLLFFGAIGSFFLTLSIYLQSGTGRSAWEAGLVMLPYAVGSIITSGAGVALVAKAGRVLLVCGALTLALSQAWMWLVVRDGTDPGYWALAAPLFVGGLGLGLTAPILVNMVLAGVPGRDAGAAGGVLSTVNQLGGAIGVAALGTVFFSALTEPATSGLKAHGHAMASVLMPWQLACYLAAALLLTLLPKVAAPAAAPSGDDEQVWA
ncbi:MFS transporter [Yimella sp. cx-573]|nr:MFS transporter [Yimella sp. cx-573]